MFTGDDVNPQMWMWLPGSVTLEEWLPGAERILELSKTYTPYFSHEDGVYKDGQMEETISIVKSVLEKTKRNSPFFSIGQYPKGKGLSYFLVYRKNKVFGKKEKT